MVIYLLEGVKVLDLSAVLAGPLLGEHTEYVLEKILYRTEIDIRRLREEGIIL